MASGIRSIVSSYVRSKLAVQSRSNYTIDPLKVFLIGSSSAGVLACMSQKVNDASFESSKNTSFDSSGLLGQYNLQDSSYFNRLNDYLRVKPKSNGDSINNGINRYEDVRIPTIVDSSHVCGGGPLPGAPQESEDKGTSKPSNLPTDEQLIVIRESLAKELPNFFKTELNYNIYTINMVYENRIFNVSAKGRIKYQVLNKMLRHYGHLRYAFVVMDVLRADVDPDEGTVTVRWRIRTNTAFKSFFTNLQNKSLGKYSVENAKVWVDGLSTYYVNTDGLVSRIIVDNKLTDRSAEPTFIGRVLQIVGTRITTAAAPLHFNRGTDAAKV